MKVDFDDLEWSWLTENYNLKIMNTGLWLNLKYTYNTITHSELLKFIKSMDNNVGLKFKLKSTSYLTPKMISYSKEQIQKILYDEITDRLKYEIKATAQGFYDGDTEEEMFAPLQWRMEHVFIVSHMISTHLFPPSAKVSVVF